MNLSTLGLMKKTGCLIVGFDAVKRELAAPGSMVKGIALSNDISQKTKKEILFYRDKYRPELDIAELDADMKQIGDIIGKKTAIAAITDEGFWKVIFQDCKPIK